jgi:hypothetical protein
MLVNHLKLIDDLWQKLFYVKWNAKSFAMLARLAQDMVQFAKIQRYGRLSNWSRSWSITSKVVLAAGGVPQEADRQRLTALIDALHHGLVTDEKHGAERGSANPPPAGAACRKSF